MLTHIFTQASFFSAFSVSHFPLHAAMHQLNSAEGFDEPPGVGGLTASDGDLVIVDGVPTLAMSDTFFLDEAYFISLLPVGKLYSTRPSSDWGHSQVSTQPTVGK